MKKKIMYRKIEKMRYYISEIQFCDLSTYTYKHAFAKYNFTPFHALNFYLMRCNYNCL